MTAPQPNDGGKELARAKWVAKRLAERLDTLISDRKVNGCHALDNGTWCRNALRLMARAKRL